MTANIDRTKAPLPPAEKQP